MDKRSFFMYSLASVIILDSVLIVRKIYAGHSKGTPKWSIGTNLIFNNQAMSITATTWHRSKSIDDVGYFNQWWYQLDDYREYPEDLMLSMIKEGYIVFP